MSWSSRIAAAGFAALAAGGCSQARLQDEWALTVEQLAGLPLEVADSFPVDGAVGIGHRIQPYVLFNRPLSGDERASLAEGRIVELADGTAIAAGVDLDGDAMGLHLRPDDLHRHEDYRLSFLLPAEAEPGSLEPVFATEAPSGAAFNMSTGLRVEAFGGSAAQARSLTDSFRPGVYPLWVLQVLGLPAELTGPTRVDVVFAPARIDDDPGPAHFLKREYGYVGRFDDVVVAGDGTFERTQDGVFLPIWSADEVVLLHIVDATLSGRLVAGSSPGLFDLRLTGVLGTRWLIRLQEEAGPWRAAAGQVRLDVDTNGNGVPDSATFTLVAEPTPIPLDDIDL